MTSSHRRPGPTKLAPSIVAIGLLVAAVGVVTPFTSASATPIVNPSAAGDLVTTAYSPNPSSSYNKLNAVSAISASDAWAVGAYQHNKTRMRNTLTLHWDGSKWTRVWSPTVNTSPPRENVLSSVSAISSTDVWSVGWYYNSAHNAYRTFTLHWDGAKWTRVWSPNVGSLGNYLYGVSAVSATDVWAVGDFDPGNGGAFKTLTLHWDGATWSRVPSPSPGTLSNQLFAVSAVSSTDVWAVGEGLTGGITIPIILHWDGTRWLRDTTYTRPEYLTSVSGVSSTDAWAVGDHFLHWDGSTWSQVAAPPILEGTPAVCAVSSTDAWVTSGGEILHWNGAAWSVQLQGDLGQDTDLYGVDALSGSDAWAVGSADDLSKTLILHWDGASWTRT